MKMTKNNETQQRDSLKIVIVGHVDHGKSTLVGRLFHDTGSLPDGKLDAIKAMCDQRGMAFEYAFLMDAMQAERDQGITIDTSQIWFKTEKRDYVIIDAPGHTEFLKNMITGAASSEAAVLVIDANEGVKEQSRKHGYLLHLLGVTQIAVAVNKMDMIDYDQKKFDAIETEYRAYLTSIGVTPTYLIPVSARKGDNIANRSENMNWYEGPTVVEALDSFKDTSLPVEAALRFPVQDVYKFDERRILAGRIESGSLKVGDELIFSPSNKKARIKSIEAWSVPETPTTASAGQSVGITLDHQLFIERGELASHVDKAPFETDVFTARLFWLAHKPLQVGSRYTMKLHTGETQVEVQEIRTVINTDSLTEGQSDRLERNSIGEIILRAKKMLALDSYAHIAATGRFVLIDNYNIAGGGIINMDGYTDQRQLITQKSENITRVMHDVTEDARAARNGHIGGVLWFTGLSGSGKSTLSVLVEKRLFQKGYQSYVLDGDNIRHGLNVNLGFSPEDRTENIRRIGEVSGLFSRAGMVAITSFISPYRSDRNRAREAVGQNFHEIYIKADVEDCEKRDPKGLYRKARTGEIAEFTGISAPYEAPLNPELVVDTVANDIETCVDQIVDYIEEHLSVSRAKGLDFSI